MSEHVEPLPGVVNIKEDLRTAVSLMFTHGVTWLACVDDDGFYKATSPSAASPRCSAPTYRRLTDGASRTLRIWRPDSCGRVRPSARSCRRAACPVIFGIRVTSSISPQHLELVAISCAIAIAIGCRSESF